MDKIPTYELFLKEDENIELALVKDPAIEIDFMYFNDEVIKMEFNEEQMIVKGPALIPNRKIYRNDIVGERNVFMSEKTVQQFAEYLINKQGNKFNLGHTDNIIQGNIIESYFTTDTNEFNVPKGSWIIAIKLKSKEAWEQVKAGDFKGFSIEGLFSNELVNFNKEEKMDLKEKLQAAINAVLFGETQVVVEEFAAPEVQPTETPVEVEVETPEVAAPSEERVQEMINEAVMSATEKIMVAVQELVNQGKQAEVAMSAMKIKLEEFSIQPLTQPITESVNSIPTDSKYAYMNGMKF